MDAAHFVRGIVILLLIVLGGTIGLYWWTILRSANQSEECNPQERTLWRKRDD